MGRFCLLVACLVAPGAAGEHLRGPRADPGQPAPALRSGPSDPSAAPGETGSSDISDEESWRRTWETAQRGLQETTTTRAPGTQRLGDMLATKAWEFGDDKNLSFAREAFVSAGLVETLNDAENTFTLIVPTNAAMEAMLGADLTREDFLVFNANLPAVMMHYIVQGTLLSEALMAGATLMSMAETPMVVRVDSEGGVFMGIQTDEEVKVTIPDVPAVNGVVHVVDAALNLTIPLQQPTTTTTTTTTTTSTTPVPANPALETLSDPCVDLCYALRNINTCCPYQQTWPQAREKACQFAHHYYQGLTPVPYGCDTGELVQCFRPGYMVCKGVLPEDHQACSGITSAYTCTITETCHWESQDPEWMHPLPTWDQGWDTLSPSDATSQSALGWDQRSWDQVHHLVVIDTSTVVETPVEDPETDGSPAPAPVTPAARIITDCKGEDITINATKCVDPRAPDCLYHSSWIGDGFCDAYPDALGIVKAHLNCRPNASNPRGASQDFFDDGGDCCPHTCFVSAVDPSKCGTNTMLPGGFDCKSSPSSGSADDSTEQNQTNSGGSTSGAAARYMEEPSEAVIQQFLDIPKPPSWRPDTFRGRCYHALSKTQQDHIRNLRYSPQSWNCLMSRYNTDCLTQWPDDLPQLSDSCLSRTSYAKSVTMNKPWGDYSAMEVDRLEILGWSRDTWQTTSPSRTAGVAWEDLTYEDRAAVVYLGVEPDVWDLCPQSPCVERLKYIQQNLFYKSWDQLLAGDQGALGMFGWRNQSWEAASDPPPAWKKTYDNLDVDEVTWIRRLGFTADTWSGCPDATCLERLEFQNWKFDVSKQSWNGFREGDQKRLQVLGWTEALWDPAQPRPSTMNKEWVVLTQTEKEAAQALGYFEDTWQGCAALIQTRSTTTTTQLPLDPTRRVRIHMEFDVPYARISGDLLSFRALFAKEVASALYIAPARVTVRKVDSAPTTIEFDIARAQQASCDAKPNAPPGFCEMTHDDCRVESDNSAGLCVFTEGETQAPEVMATLERGLRDPTSSVLTNEAIGSLMSEYTVFYEVVITEELEAAETEEAEFEGVRDSFGPEVLCALHTDYDGTVTTDCTQSSSCQLAVVVPLLALVFRLAA